MKKKKMKPTPKVKAKATKAKGKLAKPVPVSTSLVRRAKIKPIKTQTIIRRSMNDLDDRRPEEKPLTASEVQKYRDILSQKQEELSEIVHRKKEEQEFQQEEPEIGDEADIATRSVEKELLFDITDSEKQNLDGIEAALRKIEKGAFGRCESCQKTIPRLRLDVMPWARYCIQCQARNETPAGSFE